MALKRVELLRDGASAQYGSDAIAGVINYVTRDSSESISLEYMTGECYKSDGESRQFALNGGFPFAVDGFVNVSLEYGERDPTSRSVQRPDAQNLIDVGATGIAEPARTQGQPAIDDELKLFVNSALPAGDAGELYAFGNYSQREVSTQFFWRNPNSQGGIFTEGEARLVLDLSGDGSGDEASWKIGPLASQGATIGSHGYPGFARALSGKWSRDNYAVYLDLGAEVTEDLLLGVALRYEEFQDFGSTTNYKVASRYQLNPSLTFRASASTGFRAPTPG